MSVEYKIINLKKIENQFGGPVALNNAGHVVGMAYLTPTAYHGYLFKEGTFTDLFDLQPFAPVDINIKGQVLGMYNRQLLLYENGKILSGVDVGLPFSLKLKPAALNDSGYVVGAFDHDARDYKAFVYGDGTFINLGFLLNDYQQTQAHDINNSDIAVGSIDIVLPSSSAPEMVPCPPAFLYQAGNFSYIGDGSAAVQAFAINSAAVVVGRMEHPESGGWHAFRYKDGTLTDIDTLNSAGSRADGINDAEQIVGRFRAADNGSQTHAFIYEDNLMKDLNEILPAGSSWDYLAAAKDINNKGEIIGFGYFKGEMHGFLLQPVSAPEPPTGLKIA